MFATMLEQAVRICGATFGNIYRWDGEALHIVATHNTPTAFAEERKRSPYRPDPKSPVGHMVAPKHRCMFATLWLRMPFLHDAI